MFKKFFDYANYGNVDAAIDTAETFIKSCSGKSFMNSLYRIHNVNEIGKWNAIVAEAFPDHKDTILVFGYDWLGRQFAINRLSGTILMFEPGTGEVLDIPVNFEDFHNVEIAEYSEDSLASLFFEEWFEKSKHILTHNECAGYKVPLFLGGKILLKILRCQIWKYTGV